MPTIADGRPSAWRARLGEGFVYQGEPSAYRKGECRGTPSADLAPTAFVLFLQNHDQVGNRPFGDRTGRARGCRGARGGDRPAAPLSADPVDLHGRGGGQPHALPLLRPSSASSPRRCATGGAASSRLSPASSDGETGRIDSRSQRAGALSKAAGRSPTTREQARARTASCWPCAPLPWCRILPARASISAPSREARPASPRAGSCGNGAVLALVGISRSHRLRGRSAERRPAVRDPRWRRRRRSRRPPRQDPRPSPS